MFSIVFRMIVPSPSERHQTLYSHTRCRIRKKLLLGCILVVGLVTTLSTTTNHAIQYGVLSFVITKSSFLITKNHQRTECIDDQDKRSILRSSTNDEGDVLKSYSEYSTSSKKKKASSSTFPKSVKPNKPRRKAKNLFNNHRGSSSIITSKPSRGTVGTVTPQQQQPPPLLVMMMDHADFDTTTFVEQQRQRLHDSRIEKECIHYTTCSGCTIGHDIANTNVIRAAQRYFATERYDGGSTTTSTMPTTMQQQQRQSYGNVRNNRNKDSNNNDPTMYPIVIPTPTTQWRTQAKLAAANKSSSAWRNMGCTFGLYEKGSHIVSPIPECVVHHPSINMAIQLLEQATARTGTVAYSENTRGGDSSTGGDLRYVQLQVERITGHVCLSLVYNAATLKECQPSLSRLVKELTKPNSENRNESKINIWHSIWCHCNDSTRNNIFSRIPGRWHRLVGPEFMREPIPVQAITATTTVSNTNEKMATITPAVSAGWLYFSPLTFRQGNLDGFDVLALNVARSVPCGSKVCELYGGVGVLGLTTLAYHFYQSTVKHKEPLQWLRCSDENPANVRCFDRSVDSLSKEMTLVDKQNTNRSQRPKLYTKIPDKEMTIGELAQMMESGQTYNDNAKRSPSKKVSYMVASAGKALQLGQALGANVLIVDPPRKGLEEEVLEELCKPYEPNQPYVESATMLSIPDERVNWVNDVQTLIYVSCGFDALASDCDRLLSSRSAKWKLQSTTGYILFPGSDHVETVAIFTRS